MTSLANPTHSSRPLSRLLCLASLLVCAGAGAWAQTPSTWNAASGLWSTAASWSNGVPASNAEAFINNGGTVLINNPSTGPARGRFVWLGSNAGTTGNLEIRGGYANFGTLVMGGLGTGHLTVADGGKLTTYGGPIGSDINSVGTALVDGPGSLWVVQSELIVGGNGNGTLTLTNGGTVQIQDTLNLQEVGLGTESQVARGTINIGTGGAPGFLIAKDVHAHEGIGTIDFNHNASAYVFTPSIYDRIIVNHTGPGTTILASANSYFFPTTVSNGKLVVRGSLDGSGEVSVQANGALGGAGVIASYTEIAGKLTPGEGIGLLSFGSDVSLTSDAEVEIELSGYIRGSGFDAVNLVGSLAYGGELDLILMNGFQPKIGDSFKIFGGYTSQSGTFSSISFNIPGYAGTFVGSTGTVVITAVPEPGVLGLVGLGLLWTASRRLRRSSAPGEIRLA